ncbi:D-glutamate cyclase family protein [Pseudarthrobacter sp. YAF2]|uniref:D-glutamate cyclase family protein n=1 Tax=Pseudarthrobacter sp. YAF2 TaxID=3233078 RepID=UPI003F9909AD
MDEPHNILAYWQEDLIAVLLGCSYTLEWALEDAGVPLRHKTSSINQTAIFLSNKPASTPYGRFKGPVMYTMRAVPARLVAPVVELTSRMPHSHGAPLHIGSPEMLGIDLKTDSISTPPRMEIGDVPLFWGCNGILEQTFASSKIPFAIYHSPGKMFVTDHFYAAPLPRG